MKEVFNLLHCDIDHLLWNTYYDVCSLFSDFIIFLLKSSVFTFDHVSTVIQKGQVMSPYFRLLNKTGGYTWVQICATVVVNNKNGDEQNIICVNYVIR